MKRLIVLAVLISQCWAAAALAVCRFEGETYKTGEKAGGLTCQPDGTWK